MAYGYEFGNPFGDPSKFTRSTGEDEIDRFNQYMRSRPWWQQAQAGNQGDWTDQQKQKLQASLASQGIQLPDDFHIDEGGNFNQKSRVKGRIVKGAIIAGLGATGLGLAGIGPLAELGGAAGGASAASSAVPSSLASTVPTIAGSNLAAGSISGAGLSGLGSGGSVLGSIGSMFKGKTGDVIGAGLSGLSRSQAANRGAGAEAEIAQNDLNLRRAQEDRMVREQAWRDMLHAEYVKNFQPSGVSFSPYSRPIQGPSDTMRQGAGGLSAEAMQRLLGGSTLPPTRDIRDYAKPGAFERIAGYAAPFFGAMGGRK